MDKFSLLNGSCCVVLCRNCQKETEDNDIFLSKHMVLHTHLGKTSCNEYTQNPAVFPKVHMGDDEVG